MKPSEASKDGAPAACPVAVLRFFLTRRGRWLALFAVAALAVVFHAPLLTALGRCLVVERPLDGVTHLWIRDKEEGGPLSAGDYDLAAEYVRRQPDVRIVVVEREPSSLVRTGVLPSFVNLSRRELAERGVPADSVLAVPGDARDNRHVTRLLGAWLSEHGEARVLALSDRLGSQRLDDEINHYWDPAAVARVGICLTPTDEPDESNWWRSRTGMKKFFVEAVRLAFAHVRGQANPPPRLPPDVLERDFLNSLGGPPP